MTVYVLRDGVLVEKSTASQSPSGPFIVSDLPPYVSPVAGDDGRHPVVDGRRARREDLARSGCIEAGDAPRFVERHAEVLAKKYGTEFVESRLKRR